MILELSGDCAGINRTGSGVFSKSVYKPDRYPHLFQPLEWYEERSIEDMPEYVKCKRAIVEEVGKVFKWFNSGCDLETDSGLIYVGNKRLIPATEQDYITYINSKK